MTNDMLAVRRTLAAAMKPRITCSESVGWTCRCPEEYHVAFRGPCPGCFAMRDEVLDATTASAVRTLQATVERLEQAVERQAKQIKGLSYMVPV